MVISRLQIDKKTNIKTSFKEEKEEGKKESW